MTHMVMYETSDGGTGYEPCPDLETAVQYVEYLRNDHGVDHARIFRLEEVRFDFRPYYRVELGPTGQPLAGQASGGEAAPMAAVIREPVPHEAPDAGRGDMVAPVSPEVAGGPAEPAPVAEVPVTEAPVSGAPVVEAPVVEAPSPTEHVSGFTAPEPEPMSGDPAFEPLLGPLGDDGGTEAAERELADDLGEVPRRGLFGR